MKLKNILLTAILLGKFNAFAKIETYIILPFSGVTILEPTEFKYYCNYDNNEIKKISWNDKDKKEYNQSSSVLSFLSINLRLEEQIKWFVWGLKFESALTFGSHYKISLLQTCEFLLNFGPFIGANVYDSNKIKLFTNFGVNYFFHNIQLTKDKWLENSIKIDGIDTILPSLNIHRIAIYGELVLKTKLLIFSIEIGRAFMFDKSFDKLILMIEGKPNETCLKNSGIWFARFCIVYNSENKNR